MASEGKVLFADSAAATKGINDLAGMIAHIELSWTETVRVDPLTPRLAMVAMPFREILTDKAGKKIEDSGYFTGLAERGQDGWKFRNAHWSLVNTSGTVR
jgi:hypothetical protein